MAWTAPKTWTVGEVLTAAGLNTHLRDDLLALRGAAEGSLTGWSPSAGGWATFTTQNNDDLGGWTSGQPYWTAPYGGRYLVTWSVWWGGATGSGTFGALVDHYDATGVSLLENVCGGDSAVLNGRLSISGFVIMSSGERLYFGGSNGASGVLGSLTGRASIIAHG